MMWVTEFLEEVRKAKKVLTCYLLHLGPAKELNKLLWKTT
jgi:hypothetical protein